MKRLFIIGSLALCVNLANAQWDWGSGSSSSGGSSGSSSSSGSGSGSGSSGSGSSSSGSSSGGAGGGAATPPTAEIVVPNIGTHYDDKPEEKFVPRYTQNDDGINITEGIAVAYPYQREADVKFKRRIWRRLDMRQKLNKSFTWPKNPITQQLYELATKGKVRAYWTDSLNRIMSPEDAYKQGSKLIVTQIQNWRNPDDPTDVVDTAYFDIFKWDKIQRFEIMEDWIFDYKYGEFRPRIISIAPLYEEKYPNGMTFELPLFWLKMDDLRPTLAKSEVYNRYNDAMRISWDDLFNNYRLFDSYVVKQTDWDDRYIAQKPEFQTDGLGALLEGERIRNELFIFEHDLWEY